MTGQKTHEQQLRIIEKRENTANADKDFDPRTDLKTPQRIRQAQQEETHSPAARKRALETDDRRMLRGEHQESRHHKNRPDD